MKLRERCQLECGLRNLEKMRISGGIRKKNGYSSHLHGKIDSFPSRTSSLEVIWRQHIETQIESRSQICVPNVVSIGTVGPGRPAARTESRQFVFPGDCHVYPKLPQPG
jgi:hypothetical protein